jgi:glucokinase
MSIDAVIGIDIGGTFSKYGLVDRTGKVYVEDSIKTFEHREIHSFLETLHRAIMGSINKLPEKFNLRGIGIGAPNGNYYSGAIEYAPNLNWKGRIPLTGLLKEYFNLPIVLTNDANAAALGEMMYGGARNMKDFIVITLGTGLGSGIVVNGNVVYGHDGFAGEMGHITAVEYGRRCGCGKQGCLETYASATGIKRSVFELMANRTDESELRGISANELTAKMISQAAEKGDKIALKAFEYTGRILGRCLADAVAYTSPEAVFLFGGLAKAGDLLIKPTKESMEKNLLKVFRNKVKILPSGLMNTNAAVLGSSGLIWKELLS